MRKHTAPSTSGSTTETTAVSASAAGSDQCQRVSAIAVTYTPVAK